MADLAALMQVAPITGGMMIGAQNNSEMQTADVERQRLAQLVQELQLKNQQSAGMNPLLQQYQQGLNATQQAQLPGIQAKSLLEQLTAQQKQGTVGSDTEAAVSNNQNTVRANKQKDMDSLQQDLMQYGSTLDSVPVPMRAQVLRSMLQASGHDLNNPGIANLVNIAASDPANMHSNLQAAADHIGKIKAAQDPTYLASTQNEASRAKSHLEGIQEQGKNSLAVVNAQAAAGRWAKKQDATDFDSVVRAQLAKAAGDPVKTYTILVQNAQIALSSGNATAASDLMARAEAIKPTAQAAIAKVNPNQVDPNAMSLPTNPVPSLTPGGPLGEAGAPQKKLVPTQGKTSSGVGFRVLQQ